MTNTRSKLFAAFGVIAIIASIGALSVNAQTPDEQGTTDKEHITECERHMQNMRGNFGERQGEMETILEEGDYEAWLAFHADHELMQDHLTKENFQIMQEAHKLRTEGDFEAARELLKNSGLPERHQGKMHKEGKGREMFNDLPQEVKDELKELRDAGDHDAAHELMQELRDQR